MDCNSQINVWSFFLGRNGSSNEIQTRKKISGLCLCGGVFARTGSNLIQYFFMYLLKIFTPCPMMCEKILGAIFSVFSFTVNGKNLCTVKSTIAFFLFPYEAARNIKRLTQGSENAIKFHHIHRIVSNKKREGKKMEFFLSFCVLVIILFFVEEQQA